MAHSYSYEDEFTYEKRLEDMHKKFQAKFEPIKLQNLPPPGRAYTEITSASLTHSPALLEFNSSKLESFEITPEKFSKLVKSLEDEMALFRKKYFSAKSASTAASATLLAVPVSLLFSKRLKKKLTDSLYHLFQAVNNVQDLINSDPDFRSSSQRRILVGIDSNSLSRAFAVEHGLSCLPYFEVRIVIEHEMISQGICVPETMPIAVAVDEQFNLTNIPVAIPILQ